MLLIYTDETAAADMSRQEKEKIQAAHWAVMDEATQRGVFRGAGPLQPTSCTTTVRKHDGKLLITDGPFAETKNNWAAITFSTAKTWMKRLTGQQSYRLPVEVAPAVLKFGQSGRFLSAPNFRFIIPLASAVNG